jgi:hypothetical protein
MENDSDKILQEMIYEVRMLTSIVFLNFLLTVGIVGAVIGVYWLTSK